MWAEMKTRSGFSAKVASALQRVRLLRREKAFIGSQLLPLSKADRRFLVEAFSAIDKNVPSAHSPAELLFVAQIILGLNIPGPIVECGSFKGASAAKLSLVGKLTGRRVFVCDCFGGLPELPNNQIHHRVDGTRREFRGGEYAGTLEEVRENILTWVELSVCQFVPGLFQDALPRLRVDPAVVFMDVDYVSSARDCLKYLWPQLRPQGYFFTHEAVFVELVEGISDARWWHENLGQCPPVLYGAGHGVDALAPYLAYFRKTSHAQ